MLEYLQELDNKKLAEFYCYFNSWEYPPELNYLKPKNWDLLPMQSKYGIIKPIIDYIKSRVSEKELSREWNKERFPGIDFDIWWENRQPISELAKIFLKKLYKLENSNLN